MNQALSSYQKNQISGMSQKDLIVLLYSGAGNFLRQAIKCLKDDQPAEFSDAIERAHRIIYHLYTTLDFERGGEIAERLGALYTFFISQLYIVNSTKNEKILSDLLVIITDLKEGWQGLVVEDTNRNSPRTAAVMPGGRKTIVSAKV